MATFVGTSNVLSAPQSQRLLGVDAAHSLRPERIRIDGDPVGPDEAEVTGTVQRRAVPRLRRAASRAGLDDGSHLTASVASHAATAVHTGAAVRLSFPRAAAFVVTDTGTALGEAGGDLPELDLASVAANA